MKNVHPDQIVYVQMKTRQIGKESVPIKEKHSTIQRKRQLRNMAISIAAALCLTIGGFHLMVNQQKAAQVMSHITADFEYDDTLGRLQFVSNILPDSAMVFLESAEQDIPVFKPSDALIAHTWNQEEPWIEYDLAEDILACSDGDVMTVVKNRENAYTVRVLHNHGYESVYSGLNDVDVAQFDKVKAGDRMGKAGDRAAFELRKDGMSIQPEFEDAGGE